MRCNRRNTSILVTILVLMRCNWRNAIFTILVLGRNAYISYYISTDAMQHAQRHLYVYNALIYIYV
jgi:hypothetical protein